MTKTDIWNLALAYLGQASLNEQDDNDRARKCRLFYPVVKNAALCRHDWTFARKVASLAELDMPDKLGRCVYTVPPEALKILGVYPFYEGDFTAYENMRKSIPWRMFSYHGAGQVLVCAEKKVWAEYISSQVDESAFDPLFTKYVALKLASELCMTLTGNDGLLAQCEAQAARALDEAQYANVNNEEHFANTKSSYLP